MQSKTECPRKVDLKSRKINFSMILHFSEWDHNKKTFFVKLNYKNKQNQFLNHVLKSLVGENFLKNKIELNRSKKQLANKVKRVMLSFE